jgi:hypothetical protein
MAPQMNYLNAGWSVEEFEDAPVTLHAYKYMCYLSCSTIILGTLSLPNILSLRLFNQAPV